MRALGPTPGLIRVCDHGLHVENGYETDLVKLRKA